MAPRAAFVSFRFGMTDGVSVVARTWMDAFEHLGFEVLTVTGEPGSHHVVPGLAIDATDPDHNELVAGIEAALADVDLVVVENLLTIPLNLPASRALAEVLRGRPALLHHHDPPWHRERFAHITELPAQDPAWRHVSINRLLREQLGERGIDSTVIYNAFANPGRTSEARRRELRTEVRRSIGIAPGARVVAHPVRAIERKNVPAAVRLAEALDATYWLLGPAEEGYGPELERVLATASCPVVHEPWGDVEGIYAAADHITFPSTWEGFGNPPIEAALHRRTVSVGDYPVAHELRALGFEWFDPTDVDAIRAAIQDPTSTAVRSMLDHNEKVAGEHFSLGRMRTSLHRVLDEAGWLP
jgi:glycosyltransferase involved in cell wall biosynthesis